MISNTYNRYLWLLNTLLIYKKVSFEEFQERWEKSYMYDEPLSKRTFHMHRRAVEEMFDINIVCDSADGYRYYIDEKSLLNKNKARKWLINSFNISNMVNEGKKMKDRIILEEIPSGTSYLSTVIDAMQSNWVLDISYLPFYEDEPTTYHISPYCLKVHHQRWYILGKVEELEGLRHFALDRTLDMMVCNRHFTYPKNFSPENYYRHSVGIWVDDQLKPEKVVIRAYGEQAKYLHTLPLHHTQQHIEITKDYCDYKYNISITKDLVYELLKMGKNIEVLQPESLRETMKNHIEQMLERYQEK